MLPFFPPFFFSFFSPHLFVLFFFFHQVHERFVSLERGTKVSHLFACCFWMGNTCTRPYHPALSSDWCPNALRTGTLYAHTPSSSIHIHLLDTFVQCDLQLMVKILSQGPNSILQQWYKLASTVKTSFLITSVAC